MLTGTCSRRRSARRSLQAGKRKGYSLHLTSVYSEMETHAGGIHVQEHVIWEAVLVSHANPCWKSIKVSLEQLGTNSTRATFGMLMKTEFRGPVLTFSIIRHKYYSTSRPASALTMSKTMPYASKQATRRYHGGHVILRPPPTPTPVPAASDFIPTFTAPKIPAPSSTTVYIPPTAGSLPPPPPINGPLRQAHRRCGQAALGGGSTAGDFSNRNARVRLLVSEAKFSTRITGRFS